MATKDIKSKDWKENLKLAFQQNKIIDTENLSRKEVLERASKE